MKKNKTDFPHAESHLANSPISKLLKYGIMRETT